MRVTVVFSLCMEVKKPRGCRVSVHLVWVNIKKNIGVEGRITKENG